VTGVLDGIADSWPDTAAVTAMAALLGWLPEPDDRVFKPVVPAQPVDCGRRPA